MVSKSLRRWLLPLIAAALCACAEQRTKESSAAAVAMPDSYSADVAADVLSAGGNAVDAAIAAAFSLAVTWPEAGNIGGGGFMLLHVDGETEFIDYRETAPQAAHRDMYLDEDGDVVPNASLMGHRAAGVPGTVAGMWLAHQRHGSRPWEELLQPAIRLAREGFAVHEQLAASARQAAKWYGETVDFEVNFGRLVAGQVFRQPDLARTLDRIARLGPDDFYRGETARLIVAEMRRGGGLISATDLADYEAVVRQPLRASWRDMEIVSSPPPSSGGFAIVQLLTMKDLLSGEFDGAAHNSAPYVHLVAEMCKRVFADRAEYLGDPDFVDNPMDRLLSNDYLSARAAEIDPDDISATGTVRPGIEPIHTAHFSILDRAGNAVSNTYTLNWDFGSGVVVRGAGFLLNDEMDDFSAKPGVANIYGVVGNDANAIQPGKRMLSSMSPTILLRDGEVEMVIGSTGGSTIFTTVFQSIVNIYDFGMSPQAAIAAGRFHHQLLPPTLITYSPGVPLPADTVSALEAMNYTVQPHAFRFGNVQVIMRRGSQIRAASDPRKRGVSRIVDP